ncbi:MAG: hypothetical protein M1331_00975 [Candidatus Marsarchaeota archaeon]|nr:hypothetical protein [Candidatus Marsarchaeota archaeon]MCL5105956.1 hypothetical protein [Candidatus Marsarchaeota archaeon]
MSTTTITINVDEKVASGLRKRAAMIYGKKKGSIGKAVTIAVQKWLERTEKDVNVEAISLLEKGFKLGGIKDKERDAWHER